MVKKDEYKVLMLFGVSASVVVAIISWTWWLLRDHANIFALPRPIFLGPRRALSIRESYPRPRNKTACDRDRQHIGKYPLEREPNTPMVKPRPDCCGFDRGESHIEHSSHRLK